MEVFLLPFGEWVVMALCTIEPDTKEGTRGSMAKRTGSIS